MERAGIKLNGNFSIWHLERVLSKLHPHPPNPSPRRRRRPPINPHGEVGGDINAPRIVRVRLYLRVEAGVFREGEGVLKRQLADANRGGG